MTTGPELLVWATVRGDLVLITGKGDLQHVLKYSGIENAVWSKSGHGWVIRLDQVADLACGCDWLRVPFQERVAP